MDLLSLLKALPRSPEEEPTEKSSNGLNGMVIKPGISIKDSLKGKAPLKEAPVREAPVREEIKDNHQTLEPKVKAQTVDPDAIIKAWSDYAESVAKSKPRLYSTLVNNRPVVKRDGTIMVLLNSEAQKENFVKNIKSDLTRSIQSTTGFSNIEILTEVAEVEKNGKRIYTEQDKLDSLIKKNPELGQLKNRFSLDFDD